MRYYLSMIAILASTVFAGYGLSQGDMATILDAAFGNDAVRGTQTQIDIEYGEVAVVVDGDTVRLSDGRTVRYIGIDTPEMNFSSKEPEECFARAATDRNRTLTLGKKVRLQRDVSDVDRYGRLLRYVYVDDMFVNEILVQEGFARAKRYKPDTQYARRMEIAQKLAQEKKRGLWNKCKR